MPNTDHLALLRQGVGAWNDWRHQSPAVRPDLSQVSLPARTSLDGADLSRSDLTRASLGGVRLNGAILREADLSYANLHYAQMRHCDLTRANLHRAGLRGTNLGLATLREANLSEANVTETDLTGADLTLANLEGARLQSAVFRNATLVKCSIYGASPWDSDFSGAKQADLEVRHGGNRITVDNIEAAHFVYLLLNNRKIGGALDTIARKVVLILGRFTRPRKRVLDAVREELRKHGYVPVIFDFERPGADRTATVRTLANVSRFVVADITEPRSIAHELQAFVPDIPVPVKPILAEGTDGPYALFEDLERRYSWMLPVYRYQRREDLLLALKERIIDPAEKKAEELAR